MMLMAKLSLIVLGVWLLWISPQPPTGGARQRESEEKKQATQGREVFLRYCASCHGVDAKGRGVAAPALKRRPTDLTQISARDGKFPKAKIRAIITGETLLPIHGNKQMPVWGGIINDRELADLLLYLESIQRPPDRLFSGLAPPQLPGSGAP
jgi:mono/diheme cytochrome c family protein